MRYVSGVRDGVYSVVDTETGSVAEMTVEEMLSLVSGRSEIAGARIVNGILAVTPVPYVAGAADVARNKLLTGYGSGFPGFDILARADGSFEACALDVDYVKYMEGVSLNMRSVLTVPECISHLAKDFFCEDMSGGSSIRRKVHVVLPNTLKSVGAHALSSPDIWNIEFNGILDSIEPGGRGRESWVVRHLNPSVPARLVGAHSVMLWAEGEIDMTSVESFDQYALDYGSWMCSRVLKIGTRLEFLNDIAMPVQYDMDKVRSGRCQDIMHSAVVVDVPDGSFLRKVYVGHDFAADFLGTYCGVYLLLVSCGEWQKLRGIDFDIGPGTAVFVLAYKDEEEHRHMVGNMKSFCTFAADSFDREITKDAFGKVTEIGLSGKVKFVR